MLVSAPVAAVAEENPSVYVAGSYLNLGKNNEAVLWRADKVRRLRKCLLQKRRGRTCAGVTATSVPASGTNMNAPTQSAHQYPPGAS